MYLKCVKFAVADSTIKDLDMVTHKFDAFGKEFAKSVKQSPDALIQVSIQLAYYR